MQRPHHFFSIHTSADDPRSAKRTRKPIKYGRSIKEILPDTIKLIQKLERINTKMCGQRWLVVWV